MILWLVVKKGNSIPQRPHRLIRDAHVLAKGGERSIIANISGTVTRI
jgi:hypothetical protein